MAYCDAIRDVLSSIREIDMGHSRTDHPITISRADNVILAKLGHVIVAKSAATLALKEASYPIVYYFPREDVHVAALTPTDRQTHCPYKGDASLYTVTVDEHVIENAAWSYETPIRSVCEIAGHVAFYPGEIEITRQADA